MGNSTSLPSFGRNNVYPHNDGIEESVDFIGQAAKNAARIQANKWHK